MPAAKNGNYHLPLHWGQRLVAIGSNTQYLDVLGKKAGLPAFNFDAQGSNTLDSHRLLLYCEILDDKNKEEADREMKKRKHCALGESGGEEAEKKQESASEGAMEVSCTADDVEGKAEGGEKKVENQTKAIQMRLALAKRYFHNGQRLADHDVLLSAADEIGLDRGLISDFLKSTKLKKEVLKKSEELTHMGIRSIPVFIFESGQFKTTVHGSSSLDQFVSVFTAAEEYWAGREEDEYSPYK